MQPLVLIERYNEIWTCKYMYFYYQQLFITIWQDTTTNIWKNEKLFLKKSIFNNGKIICYISTCKIAMRIESCDITTPLAHDKIDILKKLYIIEWTIYDIFYHKSHNWMNMEMWQHNEHNMMVHLQNAP